MLVKIQIASDLHIDINFKKKKFIEQKGDVLCLVGDTCACGSEQGISMLREFLIRECSEFKKVLYVAGNHEFYTKELLSIDDIKVRLKSLEIELPNFIFLDEELVELYVDKRKIIFMGTTLWSHIPDYCKKIIKNYINDYRSINVAKYIFLDKEIKKMVRHLSVEDTQMFHNDAKKFITSSVDFFRDKENVTLVLLTHHKPIWEPNPSYNPYTNYAFQSDLGNLISAPIKLAIHGHTHEPCDKMVNGVRIVSNPHGYEDECADFNDSFCIEL